MYTSLCHKPVRPASAGTAARPAAKTLAVGNQTLLRRMQAKLVVSQAGDPAELEADRMADQVMQLQDSSAGRRRVDRTISGVSAPISAGAQDVEMGLRSAAEPLDASTRAFMEPRFGSDFTGVRVHTGATAAESARALNALAYTIGEDIVFGASQYSPGTEQGRRLLSHELAHVVQQHGANRSAPEPMADRTAVATEVHRAPAGPEPGSTVGGQDAGSAMPQGPQKGCDCNPAAACNDTDISDPAFKAFQLAATWLGPAEQKIKDYQSAPKDAANAKAAKALSDHFSWTGPQGSLSPDIPKIILKVISDVRAGMTKCTFFADCSSTSGTESGKIHAGSPNAWSQTNCYEFYPPFKKDGAILQAQIALHEAIHSWESIGAVETYENEGPPKYPPPAVSAQNNPDSFACLIRDLR